MLKERWIESSGRFYTSPEQQECSHVVPEDMCICVMIQWITHSRVCMRDVWNNRRHPIATTQFSWLEEKQVDRLGKPLYIHIALILKQRSDKEFLREHIGERVVCFGSRAQHSTWPPSRIFWFGARPSDVEGKRSEELGAYYSIEASS
jgi:hypothetical protein